MNVKSFQIMNSKKRDIFFVVQTLISQHVTSVFKNEGINPEKSFVY